MDISFNKVLKVRNNKLWIIYIWYQKASEGVSGGWQFITSACRYRWYWGSWGSGAPHLGRSRRRTGCNSNTRTCRCEHARKWVSWATLSLFDRAQLEGAQVRQTRDQSVTQTRSTRRRLTRSADLGCAVSWLSQSDGSGDTSPVPASHPEEVKRLRESLWRRNGRVCKHFVHTAIYRLFLVVC